MAAEEHHATELSYLKYARIIYYYHHHIITQRFIKTGGDYIYNMYLRYIPLYGRGIYILVFVVVALVTAA